MPTPTPNSHSRWLALFWLVPIGIVAWWSINTIGQVHNPKYDAGDRFRDFLEFYSGSEALVKGTPLYEAGKLGYIYPPLLAVLLMPLAHLPIASAALVWLAIKSAAVLASIWLGARDMTRRFGLDGAGPLLITSGIIAAIGAAILADKLRAEYRMQQSNALLLLCWTLALIWLDRRPSLAGIALGFAITIKYVALITLPYLLIRRRFKAAASLLVSTIAFNLAPALILGWNENLAGLSRALGGIGNMLSGAGQQAGEAKVMGMENFGISVPSVVVRALGLPGLNTTALLTIGLLAGAVFAVAWIIYWRAGQPMFQHAAADGASPLSQANPTRHRMLALEWSGLIVAALAFSPQTNSPHLVQLVLVALAIAAALVALAPANPFHFKLAIASALVLLASLTLPPSGESTRALVDFSRRIGWPAWTMLASYLLLLAAAVPQLVAPAPPARQS